jgi:hypothetical protein
VNGVSRDGGCKSSLHGSWSQGEELIRA